MRILYVSEAFGGGVFELIKFACGAMVDRGHTVGVAYGVRPETPPSPTAELRQGVELFEMPWVRRNPLTQPIAAWRLRKLEERWRPDVVHLYSSFAGVAGALVLGGRVATVYSPQAYAFTMKSVPAVQRVLFRKVERFVTTRVTVVAASSHSEARQAEESLGALNVRIVPNGIPELDEPIAVPATSDGRPRVVGMGRLDPQRQPEACARILAGVAPVSDVSWIGGGSEGNPSARAMAAAGVPVSGWLRRDEALKRLGEATAYLHWTAWDGLPLSVLEAMARDVVVVASAVPVNEEVLGGEQVCKSEREAVELLRHVVESPRLRRRLRDEQRRRRPRYSVRQMAENWHSLYEELSSNQPLVR